MDFRLLCLALLTGTVAASYKSTEFSDCSDYCWISDIRIDPCYNAKRCTLWSGSSASVAIDFVPYFYASRLKAAVYVEKFFIYFKVAEISDVCEYTSCPVYYGSDRQLSFKANIDESLLTGNYHIKVKIWDQDDDSRDCCFKSQVKIG